MTASAERDATDLASVVADIVEPIFAPIEALAARVRECGPGRARMREDDLAPAAAMVRSTLAKQPLYAGFGFIADVGAVEGSDHFMLWWQMRGSGAARLRLTLDPSHPDHYDYLAMPWFTAARDERRRVVHGPYVDFSGSDLFTLTMTMPVYEGDRFLGITGADLHYLDLERQLVRVLRSAPGDACVINDEGRVIATNTACWVVSSRLRQPVEVGVGGVTGLAPVPGGYAWSVVTGAISA